MVYIHKSEVETTVALEYDRLAEQYDRRWQRYINDTLFFFKQWAAIGVEESVLDVACGTGEFERLLLNDHPDQTVVGVDLSMQMLNQAQRKLEAFPNVTFQLATARSLPFNDQKFDVVASANAFHYFDDPAIALAEMHRVLRSSGRLVLIDWCRDDWLCWLCDVVLRWIDPSHQQCYTQAELHGLLTAAQFEIGRSQRVRFSWLWELMVVEANPQYPIPDH